MLVLGCTSRVNALKLCRISDQNGGRFRGRAARCCGAPGTHWLRSCREVTRVALVPVPAPQEDGRARHGPCSSRNGATMALIGTRLFVLSTLMVPGCGG